MSNTILRWPAAHCRRCGCFHNWDDPEKSGTIYRCESCGMEDFVPEATDDHNAWLRPKVEADRRLRRRHKRFIFIRNALIYLALLASFAAGFIYRGMQP